MADSSNSIETSRSAAGRGLASRLRSAWREIRGVGQDQYLSAQQPTPVVSPGGFQPRRWDYPIGYNLQFTPRANLIPFQMLRNLADGWDLLRIIIETRKDQLVRLPFRFRVVGSELGLKGKKKPGTADDPRIAALTDFFASPDGENSYATWLRLILEDLFVIDAVSIQPRWKFGGGMYGFDVIDGATIVPKIDDQGRRPQPPDIAYQQIIKGLPTVDFIAPAPNIRIDQLMYLPRNRRANKIYGYSPVEQIIMTVNIALRRQLTQLAYYTEGSIPDMVVIMPENISTDQIEAFETWWNSVLSGQTGELRKAKFLEHGSEVQLLKEKEMWEKMDDWLARVVCFCFSIPPTALVSMTNRASAQQMSEDSRAEGIEPLTIYIADLMNYIVKEYIGYKDIEFVFGSATREKPLETAQVNAIYLDRGVLLPDDVRSDLGYEPLTPEQRAMVENMIGNPKLPLRQPAEQGAGGGGAAGTSAPNTQSSGRARGSETRNVRVTPRDKGEGDGSTHGQVGTV